MCISQHERPPELVALVEALTLRRSVFQLKARLLKAVRSELQAAKGSGLTWRVIWGTLRDEGYPGGYQQFCKAANRVIEDARSPTAGNGKNLLPLDVERQVRQETIRGSGLSSENTVGGKEGSLLNAQTSPNRGLHPAHPRSSKRIRETAVPKKIWWGSSDLAM